MIILLIYQPFLLRVSLQDLSVSSESVYGGPSLGSFRPFLDYDLMRCTRGLAVLDVVEDYGSVFTMDPDHLVSLLAHGRIYPDVIVIGVCVGDLEREHASLEPHFGIDSSPVEGD